MGFLDSGLQILTALALWLTPRKDSDYRRTARATALVKVTVPRRATSLLLIF